MEAILVLAVLAGVVYLLGTSLSPQSKPQARATRHTPRPRYAPPSKNKKAPVETCANTLSGKCWVVDGDTIQIGNYAIRIFGIDAPEMDHPYGRKAKSAMIALTKGHVIRAEFCKDQSYNREVARCYLPDGRDLSEELVRLGLAIDWPKYSNGCYAQFETPDARKKLWRAAARQRGMFPPRGS